MKNEVTQAVRRLSRRIALLEKSASVITPESLSSLTKGQKISITYRDSLSGDRETTFEVGPARNGVIRLYPIRDGKPVKKGIATYKLKLRGERVALVHGDSVVKVLSFKDRLASVRRIASAHVGERVYRPHTKGESFSGKDVICPVCAENTQEDFASGGLFYPGMGWHRAKGLGVQCSAEGHHSDDMSSSQIERAKKINNHNQMMLMRNRKLKADLKRGKVKARSAPGASWSVYLSQKNYPTVQDIIDSMKNSQVSYDGDNIHINGESYPIVSNKKRWEIDPNIESPDFIGREKFEANGGEVWRNKL